MICGLSLLEEEVRVDVTALGKSGPPIVCAICLEPDRRTFFTASGERRRKVVGEQESLPEGEARARVPDLEAHGGRGGAEYSPCGLGSRGGRGMRIAEEMGMGINTRSGPRSLFGLSARSVRFLVVCLVVTSY